MKRLACLAALALIPAAAFGQDTNRQCGPREAVIEILADQYGETRQAIGLAANNAMVEVFANPDTGTWTITGTLASGTTCLIASGEAFQTLSESLVPGDGA